MIIRYKLETGGRIIPLVEDPNGNVIMYEDFLNMLIELGDDKITECMVRDILKEPGPDKIHFCVNTNCKKRETTTIRY